MDNSSVLFEEGKLKIKWEDIYISIPFDFNNSNELIFYKVIKEMEKRINKLENGTKIIEGSLTELWENEDDAKWDEC